MEYLTEYDLGPVNRLMRKIPPHPSSVPLVLAVVVAILVLAVSPPAVQLDDAFKECENQTSGRCAGLWSSQCCDFVVPRTKDAPQRSTTARVTQLAPDAPGISDSLLPPPPVVRARAPEETNAGQVVPPQLSSTILLL